MTEPGFEEIHGPTDEQTGCQKAVTLNYTLRNFIQSDEDTEQKAAWGRGGDFQKIRRPGLN